MLRLLLSIPVLLSLAGAAAPSSSASPSATVAASVCLRHSSSPRELYWHWLPELQELMRRGAAVPGDLPDNQHFNMVKSLPAPRLLIQEEKK